MIVSLELKNFQSHKATKTLLHPGFNVIKGSTNSGKSSIVRALGFLFYNEPWVKSFVRTGAERCEIIAGFDENFTIRRVKSSKDNYITLKNGSSKESKFESFGRELPSDIVHTTKIHEIELSDNQAIKLNVAFQHDGLFLLQESGSVRAKFLNHLSNVHVFDNVLQNLNRDQREISTERNTKTTDLERINKSLEHFEGVEARLEILKQIKHEIDEIEQMRAEIADLEDLAKKIEDWKWKHTDLLWSLKCVEQIQFDLFDGLSELQSDVEKFELFLNQKTTIQTKQARIEKEIQQAEEGFVQAKSQYAQALRDQKICPICRTPLDEHKVTEVISQI